MEKRPDCIKHFLEIQGEDVPHYPGSTEKFTLGSAFGKIFGFKKLGIHHEVLPPGRRTSWPHAESDEEEFVYVIEGNPIVWIDGHTYPLYPGDGVGFPSGTGISHTIINNSPTAVRLLVVGEKSKPTNEVNYPLHPKRNQEIGEMFWANAPKPPLGPHNGEPSPFPSQSTMDASGKRYAFIQEFLESVRLKQREKFLSFFSPSVSLTAILPNGQMIHGASSFIKSQEDWFSAPDGRFKHQIESHHALGENLIASVVKVELLWKSATPTNIRISLLFEKREGQWYLAQIQNTLMERPQPT